MKYFNTLLESDKGSNELTAFAIGLDIKVKVFCVVSFEK